MDCFLAMVFLFKAAHVSLIHPNFSFWFQNSDVMKFPISYNSIQYMHNSFILLFIEWVVMKVFLFRPLNRSLVNFV